MKFLSLTDGNIVHSVQEEFETVWNQSTKIDSKWIDEYSKIYKEKRISLKSISKDELQELQAEYMLETQTEEFSKIEDTEIVPNAMQEEAMSAIAKLREKGENRALLIAATGTGKTYLSIFDVHQMNLDVFCM